MVHYDVIVIGSGGGAKISTPASKLGYRVALIEKGALGGTCLNRGCIPSKMLIHVSEVAETIKNSSKHFFKQQGYSIDFASLVEWVCKTIDEESQSIEPAIENNPNLTWYREHARFVSPNTICVGAEEISGDKIFIAAGARPKIPDIEGLAQTPFLTSTEALRLKTQPRRLVILGAGYIATELGFYFAGLGTETHLFCRTTPLRHLDSEVQTEFNKHFCKVCKIYQQSKIRSVEHDHNIFYIEYEKEGRIKILECDQLLVATGVVPNTDDLGLDKAGVKTNQNQFICVDEHLKTTASHIWAFGDVAGNYLFRHSANYEGQYLLETVIHQKNIRPIDYTAMPYAVFSSPQIAGVGATEEDLKTQNIPYVVGLNKYSQSAMGMALRSDSGFVKLLIHQKTRKILGCHIIGEQASVLIHEVLPIMRFGGTLEHLLDTIHIHPALSELIRNAARRAVQSLINAGEKLSTWLLIQ